MHSSPYSRFMHLRRGVTACWEGGCCFALGWAPTSACRGLGGAGSQVGGGTRPDDKGQLRGPLCRPRARGAASPSDPVFGSGTCYRRRTPQWAARNRGGQAGRVWAVGEVSSEWDVAKCSLLCFSLSKVIAIQSHLPTLREALTRAVETACSGPSVSKEIVCSPLRSPQRVPSSLRSGSRASACE